MVMTRFLGVGSTLLGTALIPGLSVRFCNHLANNSRKLENKPGLSVSGVRDTTHTQTVHFSSESVCAAEREVRVRFAPSPTGFLHLGGLRTALYNFLFAKQHGGTFILRLEDTDQTRIVPGAAQDIEHTLDWAGISPDESVSRGGAYGPYVQSERLSLYSAAAASLIESGHAYYCFCTNQRLELLKKEALRRGQTPRYDNRCRHLHADQVQENLAQGKAYVVRFALHTEAEPFEDLVFGWTGHAVGEVEGDPVILKNDGFPTYHLANVVDDAHMRVSHVLRGAEWLTSTCKHLQLYRALCKTPPTYAHLPLLLNPDGTKLSKRQGDIYISHFRQQGALPEALLDLITNCGSGFNCKCQKGKKTLGIVVHLQQRIEDDDQCRLLVDEVRNLITLTYRDQIQEQEVLDPSYILRVLHMRKCHISTVRELLSPMYSYLWLRPSVSRQQLEEMSSESHDIITRIMTVIKDCNSEYTPEFLTAELKLITKKLQKTKYSSVMKLLRLALTGQQLLDGCMNNCGKRFHSEAVKFRFLNELIKVLSPKVLKHTHTHTHRVTSQIFNACVCVCVQYLGVVSSQQVKQRVIEVLYSWTQWLKDEPKVQKAYSMLKKQGLIKKDPELPASFGMPPPSPRQEVCVFDDEDKSKLEDTLSVTRDINCKDNIIHNTPVLTAEDPELRSRSAVRDNQPTVLAGLHNPCPVPPLDDLIVCLDSIKPKIPDSVTLSSGSGVWVEEDQTELRCKIENVAPGHSLIVRWSRAGPDEHNFTHFMETRFADLAKERMNVNKTVSLNITARREDNGARYQCAALLNLNLNLIESQSEPITITVHYKPFISGDSPSDIESKQQTINCTMEGNPSPQYTWTLPNKTIIITPPPSTSRKETRVSIPAGPPIIWEMQHGA
ncbi:putative glutamate--tRNA ligase, mitochondrial [Bagarius yarrelli]|uniref:Nondiscriminating glutamyl-tRNA synthetase EARS2, mitochondrial n=1 Tax=Bagarius yarrelli TaxID=175774 RepID=A0A556VAH1_BAGYA|nr:putative glutamate--tRNA ligase, mitochondrial [Bagarius yarrelli]